LSEAREYAPEYASQPRLTIPANRLVLRALDWGLRLGLRRFRFGDGVEVREHTLRSRDGADFPLLEIAPPDLPGPAPAVIDYHGGGFFLPHTATHLRCAERYAVEGRCRVFFPDYRLSARHPFPAGFDDCFATLAWMHAGAERLGVDPARVVLLGDSAGGALAAGVAQKALDEGGLPVRAQVLVYPVTDHTTSSPSALEFDDTPLWKTASNRNMWKVYLRGRLREGAAPAYAAPLHRDDFAGLPPAWVEVAEFDPLRDEGRRYAEALRAAGVAVELREVKGGIHGYDMIETGPTTLAILAERLQALRGFLGTG